MGSPVIQVRVDDTRLERIRAQAASRGITTSEWVREAIDRSLEPRGERKPDPALVQMLGMSKAKRVVER